MPFSQSRQISAISAWLENSRPTSILDVGAGIGLYGLLARIYLEGAELFEAELGQEVRYRPPELRQLRVEGIEGFAAYRNPLHDFVYDQLHIGEALSVLRQMPSDAFDTVLAIDIIEHFSPADGEALCRELRRVSRHTLLISTPKVFSPQDIAANPLENHRSHWRDSDLRRLGCHTFLADPLSWLAVWQKGPASTAKAPFLPIPPLVAPARPAPPIEEMFVELTTNCNLRCRYCATSLPGYAGLDMVSHHVEEVVAFAKGAKVPVISVNVHGESTQVDNWGEVCAGLGAAGARLNIISNFARFFDDREVATLATFAGIRISLDSVDRVLLRAIRQQVDLRVVLHNLTRIRAQALANHGRLPLFGINYVVSDLSVFTLPELVAFAAANGFADLTLHDLAELTDLPDDRPRHLLSLPSSRLPLALDSLRRASQLAARLGLRLTIQPSLQAYLEDSAARQRDMEQVTYFKADAATLIMSTPLGPGLTRDCLDPWRVVKIAVDGSIMACCIGRTALGHLDQGGLAAVLAGEARHRLQQALLSGDAPPECRICPTRPAIPINDLRAKVASWSRTAP